MNAFRLVRTITYFVDIAIVLSIAIGVFYVTITFLPDEWTNPQPKEAMVVSSNDFESIKEYFVLYAQEHGAVESLSLLIESELYSGIDSHLLGHFVADELYKQKGIGGIADCTEDLAYACSHSVVIGALLDEGLRVFDDINDVCAQTDGENAYFMCFHGFGHGVLAYTLYELPEALNLCERVGTKKYNFYEIEECIGGVVMEMRDGLHDPVIWKSKKDKYVDTENPTSLCELEYFSERSKSICYIYLTPYLFDSAGYGLTLDKTISKNAMEFCQNVENQDLRRKCYGGFGKEFTWLVHDGDVRKIPETNDEQFRIITDRCTLAPEPSGVSDCLEFVVYALYRGGLYEPSLSRQFCESITSAVFQTDCYKSHIHTVLQNETNSVRNNYCELLSNPHSKYCEGVLDEHFNSTSEFKYE